MGKSEMERKGMQAREKEDARSVLTLARKPRLGGSTDGNIGR